MTSRTTDKPSPVPPIRKQLLVEAPCERTFRVFTRDTGRWWPAEHKIGKAPMKDNIMEPRAGGRWYELGEDGVECDWGRVLVWEPPRRVVLAWQLDAQFAFDPELVTEVEVTFSPDGPGRTRVDFEHRHLERFGPGAAQIQKAMDEGWGGILELFVKAAVSHA